MAMESLFAALMHIEKWISGNYESYNIQIKDKTGSVILTVPVSKMSTVDKDLFSKKVDVEVENKTIIMKICE